jgi:osmoprotectant transport system permease protein
MIQGVVAWFTDPANWQGPDGIPARLVEHVEYSVIALAIALLIGLPLGLLIGHTGRGTFLVAGIANSLRALPTLGLVIFAVLLLAPLIHNNLAFTIPAVLVLVLLAVPPILTNAYAGVQNVDPQARDAAAGMGMTGGQVLRKVEFPCALPLIFSGSRSATLQVIATATVAAYVSLGGFGRYVIDGLAQHNYPEMAAGAILVAVLAVLADALLAIVQRYSVSRGLSGRYKGAAAGPVAAAARMGAEPSVEEQPVAG